MISDLTLLEKEEIGKERRWAINVPRTMTPSLGGRKRARSELGH